MQSIIAFLPLTIIGYGLRILIWSFSLFWMISNLVWLVVLVLWLVTMYKAYQGEKYKLPIAGDIAENQIK